VLPLNGQNIDDLAGQTINGDERGEYTNILWGFYLVFYIRVLLNTKNKGMCAILFETVPFCLPCRLYVFRFLVSYLVLRSPRHSLLRVCPQAQLFY